MSSNYRTAIALIISLLFLTGVTTATANTNSTAYELLQAYDFPVGILPKGVIDYDIDTSTGKFDVYWNGSCSFALEGSYQLRYKSKISGNIKKDKMSNLSGVSVKVLFLWLNIVEVVRKGDNLEFSVGLASAEFGLNNFYESPQCGCGFNCKSLAEGWRRGSLGSNHFVSSV